MSGNDGMLPKQRHRIKLGELIVEIRVDANVQLTISRDGRSDLPHLTINWGNPSKNINVHLTLNKKNDEKERENIANIPESKLAGLLDPFALELHNSYLHFFRSKGRLITPGWLRRRGYVVQFLNEEPKKQFIQTLFPKRKHGKKKKWTYIPDELFLKNIHKLPGISDCYFHPRVLRQPAMKDVRDPIFAQCLYGKNYGQMLAIKPFVTPGGYCYWYAFPVNDGGIEKLLNSSFGKLQSEIKTLFPPGAWSRIYDALRLGEIGFTQ